MKAGDSVEVVREVDEKGKVLRTVPAIVVGNADEEGGAYALHVLEPNHYASVGDNLGQIRKGKSGEKASSEKSTTGRPETRGGKRKRKAK